MLYRLILTFLPTSFLLMGALSAWGQAPESYFEYEVQLDNSGGAEVLFFNLSEGDIDGATWAFGDGNYSSDDAAEVSHEYLEFNYYTVCLTVWKGMEVDEYCETFFVGPDSLACNFTDCVFPGDANGDGQADLYDMTHIGLGLGTTGPMRDDATLDWVGQPAPDWSQSSQSGINFKHLDCDGNGVIETADMDAVILNNAVMPQKVENPDENGPTVYLEFDQTTYHLKDYPGVDTFVLRAKIQLGEEDVQFEKLHGIGFYLDYDLNFFPDIPASIEYNPAAFTGPLHAEALMAWKDQKQAGQVDIGLTRINNQGASGNGPMGEAVFIIISDIIEALTVDTIELEFDIKSVEAYDEKGMEIPVNVPKFPVTVSFINEITTSTVDPTLSQQVVLFPNPVRDRFTVTVPEKVAVSEWNLYDALGQRVAFARVSPGFSGTVLNLDVHNLPAGWYALELTTSEGRVVKSVVKE